MAKADQNRHRPLDLVASGLPGQQLSEIELALVVLGHPDGDVEESSDRALEQQEVVEREPVAVGDPIEPGGRRQIRRAGALGRSRDDHGVDPHGRLERGAVAVNGQLLEPDGET